MDVAVVIDRLGATRRQMECLRGLIEQGHSRWEKIHYPADGANYLELESMVREIRDGDGDGDGDGGALPALVAYPAQGVTRVVSSEHAPDDMRPATRLVGRRQLIAWRADVLIALPQFSKYGTMNELKMRVSRVWPQVRTFGIMDKPVVIVRSVGTSEAWEPIGESWPISHPWRRCAICEKTLSVLSDSGAASPLLLTVDGRLLCAACREGMEVPTWPATRITARTRCPVCGEMRKDCACEIEIEDRVE